ncbi:thioredoxin domain-containing protein [Flavobacterium sp.]|uniref:thioredoxin family protein n=1 Tax=Flavobacterium sp. TaxID=239 RepID=UPI002633CA0D|nr:thioredoxin domain-containing protein [Flavobacterium sp.]
MKRIVLFFVLCSQFINATEASSLEEAKKLALATNKIIVVDFWATWCGPCKKMDRDTWSDESVKAALDNFVFVKIDIDRDKEIANKYNVSAIPNVFFLDGNGATLNNSLGYKTSAEILKDLDKFAISTEMIAIEMINQYKSPSYYNSLKLLYKYYNFSLYTDNDLKSDLLRVCDYYIDNSKTYLSKSDKSYAVKKQKLDLIKLFDLAYRFNFDKLEKKLAEIKSTDIDQSNQYDYWFLKYVAVKGTGADVKEVEEYLNNNELQNIIADSNTLLTFYEKTKK